MVQGMGMQQHSNSPQSMHGVPTGLAIVSAVWGIFIVLFLVGASYCSGPDGGMGKN